MILKQDSILSGIVFTFMLWVGIRVWKFGDSYCGMTKYLVNSLFYTIIC